MIKRVKLETIYKMAKEDNEKIKIVSFSRTDGMKKSTIIITNCRKNLPDVEMFMEFLGGEDSPL